MSRTVFNMDYEWKFHLGDVEQKKINAHNESYESCKSGNVRGAGGKVFDDNSWRVVDLPHDYLAESGFSPDNLHSHGYRTRDNAWYRKTFKLDPEFKGKHLLLCFEGTAVNAEFYFNGSLMERSFSAYTETVFDITDRAHFGDKPNVLSVYIKGLETEGWWYEGAGIYRHVKLYAKDNLHIAHNGIWAKTLLKEGTKNSWKIELETTVENSNYCDGTVTVGAKLFDGDKLVTESLSKPAKCGGDTKTPVMQTLNVSKPTRWDVDNPKLYTLEVTVYNDGVEVDKDKTRIGFRTFYMDKDKGFFLNGKKLVIKGTCNHQDHAGVGVAVPDSVQYYRIKRLKELGTNAYRCSHNLPNKEILDACDELGVIVMDENRRFESRKEVLEYLDIMVRRDRNHPSVIFWSLFNEEPLQNTDEGAMIFRRMRSRVLKLDDTRIITGAINGNAEGAGLEMDACGINYGLKTVLDVREKHPNIKIFGSENNSAVTTRGCYKSDREVAQVLSNYDEETVPWGQTIRETWKFLREHEYFTGIFIWTGFDYRGEPTPFKWPTVSSSFGIMDTCGFPKDSFYYNRACFTDKPMVHLMPHWNWSKGEQVRVVAVTNCEEAELFLNGKSLGRKPADVCDQPEWLVDFEKGRISVKAYRNGKCVAKDEHRTTGKPVAIKICPFDTKIKNDGHDTAVLNFCVVDKNGREVPTADNHIKFEVIGDGFVRGVGNGNPNSHELDNVPERDLFAGWCQALVTSKLGAKSIKVIATGEGLAPAELDLDVVEVDAPNVIFSDISYDLSGITMSDVTETRPDPLVELREDNMNSFMAVGFEEDAYQPDFIKGYRIYRATPALENGDHKLVLPRICADSVEIYVDGKLCFEKKENMRNASVEATFTAQKTEKADVRILIGVNADIPDGAGISKAIRIQKM